MTLAEPIQVAKLIVKLFNELNIQYFIGGSLASSLHGIPRATNDVDIVAEINFDHIDPLFKALKDEFYIDPDMIREAICRNSSFNVIHLSTMLKIDIFILKRDNPSLKEISRREEYQISEDSNDRLYLASAEDVIIHKLYWYQQGGCISERQWTDVLGILKIQAGRLDQRYMEEAAQKRGVWELLLRALQAGKNE